MVSLKISGTRTSMRRWLGCGCVIWAQGSEELQPIIPSAMVLTHHMNLALAGDWGQVTLLLFASSPSPGITRKMHPHQDRSQLTCMAGHGHRNAGFSLLVMNGKKVLKNWISLCWFYNHLCPLDLVRIQGVYLYWFLCTFLFFLLFLQWLSIFHHFFLFSLSKK